LSVTRLRNYSFFLITSNLFNAINIKLEGATVKSMSSREMEEGTQWNSPCPRREWFSYCRRHGEGNKGHEDEKLNTNSWNLNESPTPSNLAFIQRWQ